MRKYLFLLVMLSCSCISGFTQSQTRTATFLNNLNNFQQVFGTQNYARTGAGVTEGDDDIYAYTKKLSANSRTRNIGIASSSLSLQGFGFTIPENADIENISVKVKRFKTGVPAMKDYLVSVMRRYDCTEDECLYGYMWRNGDVYPGNFYPDAETEYDFLQDGNGSNGGFNHDETYEWTPAMVNHPYFGVRIDSYPIEGRGSVIVYYDMVEVTVNYVLPVSLRKSAVPMATTEVNVFKTPVIYPNPFTTKTNIQFTAAESGIAVVELYNMSGVKLQTLFSGNVVQGQVYNVTVGDVQLPKATYIYRIGNGKQKYTGRIIKIE